MAKPSIAPYGKTEHQNAIARGKQMQASPTAVLRAGFNQNSELLLLDLQNGARVELPVKDIRELRGYSVSQLRDVEISPGRDGLLWRAIVLLGIMGKSCTMLSSPPALRCSP